jgi:hypothetical protein
MKELKDYRRNLLENLVNAARDFRAASLAVKDPFIPLQEDGWSTHQVAAHTRDVDKIVYGLRARRTITEDNPEFPNFDGDAYMAQHYDPSESLTEMLDGFVESIESEVEMLRALPDEAWSRQSRHATLGHGFTLQTWVERGLAHIQEHIETVRKSSDMMTGTM